MSINPENCYKCGRLPDYLFSESRIGKKTGKLCMACDRAEDIILIIQDSIGKELGSDKLNEISDRIYAQSRSLAKQLTNRIKDTVLGNKTTDSVETDFIYCSVCKSKGIEIIIQEMECTLDIKIDDLLCTNCSIQLENLSIEHLKRLIEAKEKRGLR